MSYETRSACRDSQPPVSRWLVVLLAVLLLIQIRSDQNPEVHSDPWGGSRGIKILARIRDEIKQRFRNPPSDKELMVAAISGMLSRLEDPYTMYMPPRLKRETDKLMGVGDSGGIGAMIIWEERGIRVLELMPGGAAQKAGVKSGDLIVGVDGVQVLLLNQEQALQRLRGEVGSEIRLTAVNDSGERKDFVFNRGALSKVKTVAFRMLGNDIGFLRLFVFGYGLSEEAKAAIEKLEASGAKGLILDLRWNAGGSLDEGLALADMFLDKKLITILERRPLNNENSDQVTRKEIFSNPGVVTELPVVILINNVTASASELSAAALHDSGGAVTVGTSTVGKARFQEELPLGEGIGAIRLTVGRYLTPGGEDMQGRGLVPDYKIELSAEENSKLLRDWVFEWHGLSTGKDGEDSPSFDPQLAKALELIRIKLSESPVR